MRSGITLSFCPSVRDARRSARAVLAFKILPKGKVFYRLENDLLGEYSFFCQTMAFSCGARSAFKLKEKIT
jgi:hypothetical protein